MARVLIELRCAKCNSEKTVDRQEARQEAVSAGQSPIAALERASACACGARMERVRSFLSDG